MNRGARLWLAMGVGVALLMSSGLVGTLARAQSSVDPMGVITAYEMARNRRDVDGALAFFSDNAVITQRNVTFSGKDEIRKFLENVSTRSRFVVVQDRHVAGIHVTWTERTSSGYPEQQQIRPPAMWSGQNPTGPVGLQNGLSISVEAVVQDGKIQALSYVFGGQAQRPDQAIEGRAQLPAAYGLAAVLIVLSGLLMIASLGIRRAAPVASSLQGRLIPGLQGWAAARQ